MFTSYKLKHQPIEAIQWTGSNFAELLELLPSDQVAWADHSLTIQCISGNQALQVHVGDYIVRNTQGRLWVVKEHMFMHLYEQVK